MQPHYYPRCFGRGGAPSSDAWGRTVRRGWPAALLLACLLPAAGCGLENPPTTVPTNVLLPVGGVEVPVAIVANQMFVDATVNGAGPYRFALDTGASLSLISPA